jgi:hypothetical protein
MASPQKTPDPKPSPRTYVPLKGFFNNGVWYCNCTKRLPAAKLESRNHAQSHGKWFYTCQLPPHQKCNFFLWASDAEIREKQTVLSNSTSESMTGPQTPSKPSRNVGTGLLTPQTDRPFRNGPAGKLETGPKSAKARMMSEDTDEFGWDDSVADDDFEKLLSQPPRQPDFGRAPPATPSFGSSDFTYSPRKTPRTDSFTTPGKRKFADMERESFMTPTSIFSSQTQSQSFSPSSVDISSTPTPSKYRNALSADSGADTSDLAQQAIKILEGHGTVVPRRAMEELVSLLNRHDLKMKGITRGRDISRAAVKKKENEISILNERIATLEAQLEMGRTVLSGLRE